MDIRNELRFYNRPRFVIKDMQLMINGRGQKLYVKTEKFAKRLEGMGYCKFSLDYISKTPILKDSVLIHRHRGGLGDLITCKPGIENMLRLWDNVVLAVPQIYHFIFEDLFSAYFSLINYDTLFGVVRKHNDTKAYLGILDKFALSVDMYCPAGIHETESNFRPTEGRIRNFTKLLDGNPHKPVIHLDNCEGVMLPITKRRVVGMQIISERKDKDWPLERYAELALRLQKFGVTPITFHPTVSLPDVEHVIGVDLKTTAHIIDKIVDVFVGPDSGLLHLASALNKRTVWLFGPTDGKITLEFYDKAVMIHKLESNKCHRPCYYNPTYNDYYCGERNGDCMLEITVDEVFEAIIGQLNA